ncbi:MAG: hypothetical protein LBD96_05180 [Treponema sp.]|jgi:t-SNARE complex subunit (syntaxin)|nr:hypothetical protein [Treponema sp.]
MGRHVLLNSNILVKSELKNEVKKLMEIRNTIIHYKFNYNTSEIRSNILKVIKELRKLFREVTHNDFLNDVNEKTKEILKKTEDDYLEQLHLSQAEAQEEAKKMILKL